MFLRVLTISSASVLAIVTLMTASCAQRAKTVSNGELEKRVVEVEKLAEKRQTRENELSAMDVAQLARELQTESTRGVEPFNSMTYRELVSRGAQAAPELKSLLLEADRTSFLGLLALRQMNPEVYSGLDPSFRVSILVDALKTSKYFNSWGLPHLYFEEPAKAIIIEGEAARKPLIALLRDNRPAPMWGSDEVIEYQRYKYRVKDYAWALLVEIQGEKMELVPDPLERDKLISEFLNQPQ